MQNTNILVPTIEELRKKVKNENKELNDDYEINEILVNETLKIISNLPDFYSYLNNKNFEDYELSYLVLWELCFYVKKEYFDKDYNLIWDKKDYHNILEIILDLIHSKDNDIKTLAIIWFIEWISQQIETKEHMNNLRTSLIHDELQKSLDDVNNFWNTKNTNYL